MVDETEDMDVTHEGAGLSAPESDFPESKVNTMSTYKGYFLSLHIKKHT